MPDEDGYELIRKVRSLGREKGAVPAIALTAFAQAQDRVRALTAGFNMHIPKPVDPAELIVAIATLLGKNDQAPQVE
jgi:CheY-like chemotaxis protein